MQRLNPTGSLLRARPFVARHDYIFTLLCLLNVNMGALNTSTLAVGYEESAREVEGREGEGVGEVGEIPMGLSLEMVLAQGLLDDMADVFKEVNIAYVHREVDRRAIMGPPSAYSWCGPTNIQKQSEVLSDANPSHRGQSTRFVMIMPSKVTDCFYRWRTCTVLIQP